MKSNMESKQSHSHALQTPPSKVLRRYRVVLSSIAYVTCEVRGYNPIDAGIRAIEASRDKPTGLSIARDFQVDYTEVILEDEPGTDRPAR
jgi:hypothetical protein